ncbi:MAG: hypothetical protein DMG54_35740, partial [Acidobacteria bacterium]
MQQRTLAWERLVTYEDILLPVTQEIVCNRNFEHGPTVPSVEILEKLGRAFDMPFISYSTTVRIPQYHVCQFPALDPTLERASLIRKPPEAQSDYWFPTLRSRSHSYIANILCSIRSHAGKKMI